MATKKKKRKCRHSKRWYRGMRNRIIFGIVVLGILTLLVMGIGKLATLMVNKVNEKKQPELVEVSTQQERKAPSYLRNYDSCEITDYQVFGSHMNLSGVLETETGIKSLFLYIVPEKASSPAEYKDRYVLFTEQVQDTDTETTENNGKRIYSFHTGKKVNEGICLETFEDDEYFLMLGVTGNNGMTSYLSLKYKGENEDIVYYTLTKPEKETGRNQKVVFTRVKDYCNLSVHEEELPADVYDIVIDPGHGGTDAGATKGDLYEKDKVLEISLRAKELLEEKGYKVLITRDGSESPDEMMAFTMYEENGRVNLAGRSKAKYAVSVHLNSNSYMTTGGVQMYVTNKGNISFGKRLAEAIVATTGTITSKMQLGMQEPGVYYSTLTEDDIANSNAMAEKYQFDPFALSTDMDGLFMIRELGGRITGAFMDGRNPVYNGANQYMNSNQGVECCLAELGFLSVDDDRNRLIDNPNGYAEGLARGIEEQIRAVQTEDHIVAQY